jgi:FtsH-binding integral membrane protein
MANMLYQAHSGLRFLVLLAALIAIAVLLWGWSARRPFAGQSRAVTAVFTGVLDLQVTLGILLVFFRPWYGPLIGHLVMMIAAAFAAHGLTVYAKKQTDPRRMHMISLIGIALALLLILGGIMSIRNSPFEMTVFAGATAASIA